MNQSIQKFLEFNDKKIYFKSVDGAWWIAIKPICEALGVNYERQRQNLRSIKIYSQLPTELQVVAADGKLRNMLCLPERVIYGWLFKLESNAPGFEDFQWACNDLLFNYFHGTITDASCHIRVKSDAEKELEKIEEELQSSELYQRRQALLHKIRQEGKAAMKCINDYISMQMSLWDTEPAH